MQQIKVTADALQVQNVVLVDQTSFYLELYYRPMQRGWFINQLSYGDFTIRGLRLVNLPNMLNQWSKSLPFGLACFSDENRDPQLQEDFVSGASKLYFLSPAEVLEYTEYLTNGV